MELLNRVLRHNLRNELTIIGRYADFVDDPPADTDVEAGIRRHARLPAIDADQSVADAARRPRALLR